MNTSVAPMPDQSSDIRALTNAELDNVNGGFIIAGLILATCFFAGMWAGSEIHQAYYEGR